MKTFVSLAVLALLSADVSAKTPVTLQNTLILDNTTTDANATVDANTTTDANVTADANDTNDTNATGAEDGEGGNTGLIVGGVVGGLALVGGLIYWKKSSSESEGGEYERLL